ncbi:MAG TPA: NADH-quinone oxidoreductase subunit NuoH [Thermoanaerobaculia bacterium]|nr:NADH-quinone oxidoreductase subunit NuoH [Thermoanaerobaculia bacterium]HLN93253.1 NADH-quinone oxidoreductase subunit NuoH [Thermoanaerobaculia bacterium]
MTPTVLTYIKVVLLVALVPAIVGFVIVLAERRLMGFMQARLGPNRVGPKGLLQGVADLLKLVTKEDITPEQAEKAVYFLAPVLAVIPALTALAVIPFGPAVRIGKIETPLWVSADVNIGLLFLLAISSIGVYGIILGGWASNNKYSLLGGLRSAAQLVSYEVPMGLALVSVLLMTRSLSMVEIVQRQGRLHLWFVFPGLLAFFIYFVAGVAETNRNPFDLPEAESELVSGFNTEYSGVKFAFFFLGEYAAMIVISCVAVTVFFGGWLPPFPHVAALKFLHVVPPLFWFLIKTGLFLFGYIWFRSTFPRYRFDQLMALGWKWMIPLALGNIVIVALAILATPGRSDGLVVLSYLFGGLFVVMFLLAKVRQKLARRERLAAVPASASE